MGGRRVEGGERGLGGGAPWRCGGSGQRDGGGQARAGLVHATKGGIDFAKMELHRSILGQARCGGLEIGQRLERFALQVGDAPERILKGGDGRAAQAAGDGIGAGDGFGVLAQRGQQAGQIVRDDHIGAVFGIEVFVDGQSAFVIARLLKRRGMHPTQIGRAGICGHARGENGIGLGRFAGDAEKGIEAAHGQIIGRIVRDQAAILRDGRNGAIEQHVQSGGLMAQFPVVGQAGQCLVQEAAGVFGLAAADLCLDDERDPACIVRACGGARLEQGETFVDSVLPDEDGAVEPIGGGEIGVVADPTHGGGDFRGKGPIAGGEGKPREGVEQGRIGAVVAP